ncbi:hypothetical protein ACWA2C_31510 [Priestia megaterium]
MTKHTKKGGSNTKQNKKKPAKTQNKQQPKWTKWLSLSIYGKQKKPNISRTLLLAWFREQVVC